MTRAIFWSFLFLIAAVSFSQAQDVVFPGQTSRPGKYPLPTTTTRRPHATYIQCVNACLTTSEYNPVCGTDNVVYSNPGRLNCARSCGKYVEISNYGQCTANSRRG